MLRLSQQERCRFEGTVADSAEEINAHQVGPIGCNLSGSLELLLLCGQNLGELNIAEVLLTKSIGACLPESIAKRCT